MAKYFFPNKEITIEAETLEEALSILNSNNEEIYENVPKSSKKKGV